MQCTSEIWAVKKCPCIHCSIILQFYGPRIGAVYVRDLGLNSSSYSIFAVLRPAYRCSVRQRSGLLRSAPVSIVLLFCSFMAHVSVQCTSEIWAVKKCRCIHCSVILQFYGPRIGAVYVRDLGCKEVPLYPMFFGGGQERNYRPG